MQTIQSSKYTRKGKCNSCGACCRNIIFFIGNNKITTEREFELLKKWDKRFNGFYITGKDSDGAILFTCKELNEKNKCRVYHFRSIYCRLYPHPGSEFLTNGGKLLDKCGFYFEPDRKFRTYVSDN